MKKRKEPIMFKYVVEYETANGPLKARFTNEKHAKKFFKLLKSEDTKAKVFSLTSAGSKDKEVKFK